MAKVVNGQVIVERGDTLWSIYGPKWKEMSGYTGDPRRLQIGTALPLQSTQAPAPRSTPRPTPQPTPTTFKGKVTNTAVSTPSAQKRQVGSMAINFNTSPTGNDTWDSLVPIIAKVAQENGLPPSAVIAQAAHESNFGKSSPGNNLFGIKGTGTAGTQQLWTTENYGGQDVRVRANFAAYNNLEDSVRDYVRLITQNPRYREAVNSGGDPERYIESIKKAGYATDPAYITKVKNYERQYRTYNPQEATQSGTTINEAPSYENTIGKLTP